MIDEDDDDDEDANKIIEKNQTIPVSGSCSVICCVLALSI